MKLKFDSVNDVHDFCKLASKTDANILVHPFDCKYTVDGTSFIGLMTLDLSKYVEIELYNDNETIRKEFVADCKKWIVK